MAGGSRGAAAAGPGTPRHPPTPTTAHRGKLLAELRGLTCGLPTQAHPPLLLVWRAVSNGRLSDMARGPPPAQYQAGGQPAGQRGQLRRLGVGGTAAVVAQRAGAAAVQAAAAAAAAPVCHQSWRSRVLSPSYLRGPGTGGSPGRFRTMRGPPSPSARSAPVCPCHMYVPAWHWLNGWVGIWQAGDGRHARTQAGDGGQRRTPRGEPAVEGCGDMSETRFFFFLGVFCGQQPAWDAPALTPPPPPNPASSLTRGLVDLEAVREAGARQYRAGLDVGHAIIPAAVHQGRKEEGQAPCVDKADVQGCTARKASHHCPPHPALPCPIPAPGVALHAPAVEVNADAGQHTRPVSHNVVVQGELQGGPGGRGQ